jgi:hypothetical protein
MVVGDAWLEMLLEMEVSFMKCLRWKYLRWIWHQAETFCIQKQLVLGAW